MSAPETSLSGETERPAAQIPWRDGITLLIVFAVAMCVVDSIDRSDWVEGMPSLYPIALFGLMLGYLLAKLPWRAVFIYPPALLLGATGLLLQVLAVIDGDGLRDRCEEMVLRMRLWTDALTSGGISNDALPVIVLILVLTWLTTFFLAWSVFRWNNPWIGLIPGGLALLMNISYMPEQSSPSFVVFVLGAILLVARTHFDGKTHEWRRSHTPYPGSLHFFSLNQTVWAAALLVGAAWLTPVAEEAGPLETVWRAWTQPAANEFASFGRVFSAVQGKKGMPLDRYASFLPYRGYFNAVEGPVMTVKASEAVLLRATVYDVYTPSGWKTGKRDEQPLEERSTDLAADLEAAAGQYRQPVAIEVLVEQAMPLIVTPGQPLAVDREADVETGADPSDIISLRPSKSLKQGDRYVAVGLVSTASADDLRSSGSDYPSWATDRYLQLPDDLPSAVSNLARELTRDSDTAYDMASAIETHLRSYPVEIHEDAPPSDTDAVEYFLFEKKGGHPLYHASAMVVMLRALGVPSRLAVGFAHPHDANGAEYQIDGKNALAWPEVYFPGFGWIPFSPSRAYVAPMDSPADSPTGPAGEISQEELLDMFPNVASGATTAPEDTAVLPANDADGTSKLPWLLAPLLLLATISALAAGSRYAWNRGLAGLSRPAQLFEKTRRLSSWAGLGSAPSQTPRQFLRRLQATLPDEPDLPALSDAYERVEFGRKRLSDDDDARLDALWKRLRPRLLRRILLRGRHLGE